MIAADLLPVWHVALAEALLLAALITAINGVDDLVVDMLWRVMPAAARAGRPPPDQTVDRQPVFAIFIPAWDEADVIGAMLRRLLAGLDWPDVRIYVGLYPNDPAGIAAVQALSDPRLQPVIGPRPGPTTKADCLNSLWRAMLADEAARGRLVDAIVLHDAEDVVHPGELRVFAAHIAGRAMVQLPVLPLPDAASPLISGHYMDEFAQSHGKDLLVRQWLGAGLPSAGVGVAFCRRMLGQVAAMRGDQPFDADSLTEDYELGQRLHALGGRGVLVWQWEGGQPVATAEHFPADFASAVRQKSRWLIGISLAGWDRLGWQGGLVQRWMLLRDRKAPLMALVTVAAYVLALLLGLDTLLRMLWPAAARLPAAAQGPLLWLLWINWLLLVWRLLLRVCFTWRLHGPVEALLAMPRAAVGNLINAAAAVHAVRRYRSALRAGRTPLWDKTQHRFPGEA
ncbi:glycosyl transferase family protein [Sandarakinorhabdus sp.]|uniref:glycosyl transferase family protein n=1 Tax=Sandarakinorhabdus sp. TaxID=1916663 RepID=UPI00333EC322